MTAYDVDLPYDSDIAYDAPDVTPPPPPPVPSATPRTGRYTVEVFDDQRRVVGQTTSWLGLDMVLAFNGVGTWAVDVNGNDRVLDLLSPGGGITIRRNAEYLIGGTYTALHKTRDRSAKQGRVTISGESHERRLRRMNFPDPTKTVELQDGQTYDLQTGPAETVIYHYVNANVGPAALVDRRVPGLTMATNLARGSTVNGHADFDVLIDFINTLALKDDLGWRIRPSGTGLVFEVYVPADKSKLVRFSWELGNLKQYDWTETGPTATREIVAGQGEGVWRLFRQVVDASAETDWGVILENFVDRRDTNDDVLIDQAGADQLTQDRPSVTATFQPTDTFVTQYGRDWNVGDKVTAVVDGIEYSDVVRELRITVNAQGEAFAPTIGAPGATSATWLYRGIAQALQAIAVQQRRR